MKLLMITRKIDKDDGLAGFTYNWVKKLSKNVDKLYVICLEKGNDSGLPDNVSVYSLGKENGKNRWKEFWRFHKLARQIVPQVDGVFAHQNPEYGISIAPWTKLFRKKLIAWYVHGSVGTKLRLLNFLSDKMLSINKESFRLPSKKVIFLHHGIDTEIFYFKEKEIHDELRLLSVSRISATKQIDKMIDLVASIKSKTNKKVVLKIVGEATLEKDKVFLNEQNNRIFKLNLKEEVKFLGSVSNTETPPLYQWADIFLNFSKTGSVDKTVLEAMSSGTPVLVSNEAFRDILEPINKSMYINNLDKLGDKALVVADIGDASFLKDLHTYVDSHHSLDKLSKTIVSLF
ncbi:glycosyltransferase family 4 protein [Candidatus Parcubacteria bacterium]|jgi:glycosyltransferase involved in cell wall biosynthesis|nr:glycosyltransferase family 4 protein [Candidatus Parcubacteria bacterium]MBT7228656.1 glycosyltransferase family 4 protein [Candidatus Parcubacteria bacterium]